MRTPLRLAITAMVIGLGFQSTGADGCCGRFRSVRSRCCLTQGYSVPVYVASPAPCCASGAYGMGYSGGFGMDYSNLAYSAPSVGYPSSTMQMGYGGSMMQTGYGGPGLQMGYGNSGMQMGYGGGYSSPMMTGGYGQSPLYGNSMNSPLPMMNSPQNSFNPMMQSPVSMQGIGAGNIQYSSGMAPGFGSTYPSMGYGSGSPSMWGMQQGQMMGSSGFGYGMAPNYYAPLPAHYPPPSADLVW